MNSWLNELTPADGISASDDLILVTCAGCGREFKMNVYYRRMYCCQRCAWRTRKRRQRARQRSPS